MLFIRPSKTISLGFDNNSLDYELPPQQHSHSQEQDTLNMVHGHETIMETTTNLNELTLSSTLAYDEHIEQERYDSFLSQQASDSDDEDQVEQQQKEDEQDDDDADEVVVDVVHEEQPQLPSATADAMETYCNISENIYCGSATGKSIAEESMPCECKYRPDIDNPDAACGDDNYCINRMMFMECMVDDCPCDRYCRNRRFQLRQYARVDVIRTDKKGFGLRALTDLPTNAFIMEYIGEVIPNHEFIRRTKEYEAAGLEHYYFMTLKTDEIIDATKKGCLARFINHSCNPNSVTQKWVVGKNMRIGIFTRRPIKAGSELTFDYKFERYGAVAQKCYCGEATCKGYIGGSLKSDTAKSSATVSSDLILDQDDEDQDDDEDDEDDDDEGDLDDDMMEDEGQAQNRKSLAEAVTLTQKKMLRKMNRRRASEPLQDPREVQSFVKRMLDSVGKSHLVLKLLLRLELTDSDTPQGKDVLKKFVRLHGLKMLKFWLGEWKSDPVILLKVLQVLSKLPLANRNGLEDCKMLEIVGKLSQHEDEGIKSLATQLLVDWSLLKSVYRIPKRIPAEPTLRRKSEADTKDNDEGGSQISADVPPPRYDSSREFFDPDDDYFEYLPMDADAAEIQWKMEYPPQSTIPTAPKAMIDACIKNGFYGYGGRPPPPRSYSHNEPPPSSSMDQQHEDTYNPYKNKYDSPFNASSPAASVSTTSVSLIPTKPAGQTSPKLPNNWKSAYTEDGAIYYYHRVTGKTQWQVPEERVSSIEGVNQSDLEDLVEKTIQETENKKKKRSASPAGSVTTASTPRIITPSTSRKGSPAVSSLDETELKKQVGKIVTKYLSSKQKKLWNGDKHLFKELARKTTHHIVEREMNSNRKIYTMNSSVKSKIEKFIDAHGSEFVIKVQRKMKSSKGKSTESPSSVISEKMTTPMDVDIPTSPVSTKHESSPSQDLSPALPVPLSFTTTNTDMPCTNTTTTTITASSTTTTTTAPRPTSPAPTKTATAATLTTASADHMESNNGKSKEDVYYRRSSSSNRSSPPYRYEYVRPGYTRPSPYYHSNNYYRYPRPPSPYYRSSRYRRSPPPPFYRQNSSRRGSLSDDEMDRRRWD
ncbi:set and ww domain protein [Mucor ambiguus]|uniref:[histone H3]-lysine(36) N-trimethyltransferase n=1 Tax=Mucor ambiguus TaxID=91626 RepID=A0A0C9M9H1_9FUNG|nr:set and ww domain protein [Mucor ambiguus]